MQMAYLFLSVGLIFINILVIKLMQGILEKEELLQESALAGQKKESQLAHYRDMQAVADKYGGDFAVPCDAEKFQAVVML